jgi:cytochrome c oxidase assembly factor CtaG
VTSVPLAASTVLSAAVQLGPLALFGLLYARRVRTLSAAGQPVPGWRQGCFYGGLVTIAVALTALGSGSQELLALHMAEHLLVGDVASLLLVLGLTGPLIAPVLRVGLFNRLRVLANPAIALPLWAIDLYAWHLPVLYQAALRSGGVHALEHMMFLGFGVNVWMCLFGPLPVPRWFGGGAKVGYILALWLTSTLLANIFIWLGRVFYPFYAASDASWHISQLADQQIAGGLMMIEGTILMLGLFGWLLMSAMREAQERQNLQDLARALGVELSAERAARAVRAGRGADLRRRLEGTRARAKTEA